MSAVPNADRNLDYASQAIAILAAEHTHIANGRFTAACASRFSAPHGFDRFSRETCAMVSTEEPERRG